MEFIAANFAPVMFVGLICFLILGFPVAFSLGAAGLFFGVLGVHLDIFPQAILSVLPLRLIGIMANETLLAVPFFTLMGLILERSGMAEDLLESIGQVFGPLRGGLALAVVLVGAMLAAGVTGFPSGSITRRTADHAAAGAGCMDLTVASGRTVPVDVIGYTPCVSDAECPDGQTCDLELQICE